MENSHSWGVLMEMTLFTDYTSPVLSKNHPKPSIISTGKEGERKKRKRKLTSSGRIVEIGGHLVGNRPPRTGSMTLQAAGSLKLTSLLLVADGRWIVGSNGLATQTGTTAKYLSVLLLLLLLLLGWIGRSVSGERSRNGRCGRCPVMSDTSQTDAGLPIVTDGPFESRPFVVDQQATDTETQLLLLVLLVLLLLLLCRSGDAG